MNIIIFDTETTQLTLPAMAEPHKQPRIVELGAIKLRSDGAVLELSQLINPEAPIAEDAAKAHGIKNEELLDKPTLAQFYNQLSYFFSKTDLLIAHNAPFDMTVMRWEMHRINRSKEFAWPRKVVCTAQEYSHVFGERPRLIDVYQRIMGEPLKQTHRALDDVKALLAVIQKDNFFQRIGVKP